MVLFLTSINFKNKLQNVLDENVPPYQGNKRNGAFISCYYKLVCKLDVQNQPTQTMNTVSPILDLVWVLLGKVPFLEPQPKPE